MIETADIPVLQQTFDQLAGGRGDRGRPGGGAELILHYVEFVALGQQLAHPGVDDGEPGPPGGPRLEQLVGAGPTVPGHGADGRVHRLPSRRRDVEQHVGVELAPGVVLGVRAGQLAERLPRGLLLVALDEQAAGTAG